MMKQCIEKINWMFYFVKTNFVALGYIILLIILLLIHLVNYFIPQYGWKILALATFIIILAVWGICDYLNSALKKECDFCHEYFNEKLLPVKNGHLSKSACHNCAKDTAPYRGYQKQKDP